MTTLEAVELGRARLSQAGVASPEWDAELLLRHVLGFDRAAFIARNQDPIPPEVASRFLQLIEARASRRPLQHLTGKQGFWRHEFVVTPDVLIPRPETELAVQTSLEIISGLHKPAIADVGTGSGCIAISLALERKDATIHAFDVSARALDVARMNARLLGCENHVTFHRGDLLQPLISNGFTLDLVVSNPPYIDPREHETLPPEVRDHDPRIALVAPGNRFSVYRRLVPQAYTALRPDRWLVLEIGCDMESEVGHILTNSGFIVERRLHDLQAIPRILVARRTEPR
jgi:release factor glutamine methyltransferase